MIIIFKSKKFGKWKFYDKLNFQSWWKRKLRKNIWTQWLYIFFPFVFTAFILILFQCDGVLMMEKNEFSFLADTSNSICMIFLYILSYYLCGIYPNWIKDGIDAIANYSTKKNLNKMLKNVAIFTHVINTIALGGSLLGMPFAVVAQEQMVGWMEKISIHTRVIYYFYLAVTWYTSLCLLIYALTGSYVFKEVLSGERFNIFSEEIELAKTKLAMVEKCLSATISYALFWIIAAFIMIYNDYANVKYGVYMTFYQYPIVSIFVILVIILGVTYAILPIMEYTKALEREKKIKLNQIESMLDVEEKERLKKEIKGINSFVFSSGISKLILFLSVIVPALSLVIEIIIDFNIM